MGVKNLWRILEPIHERIEVKSLRCKVLGIDLAVWVVQAENVIQGDYQGIYLRQLFFKVTHLLENGIGVVVVTDGKAPILKAQTIADRLGVQLDRNDKIIQRRRFMKIMSECEEMLVSMGIPVLKGESEGEASAAKLQQDGKIDGVITTDGDAFLYGARTVYRNLLVTDPYCDRYCMDKVEFQLGLSRDDLIAFAILNGCDYNPQGVTGLGTSTILNYIQGRDRVRSATSELTSWVEQKKTIVGKYEQMLALKQHSHCSVCKHVGKKSDHLKLGCSLCGCDSGSPCNKESTVPCSCPKHVAKKLLASPHMICCAKLSQAALRRKLPVSEIVDEFKNYRSPKVNIQWSPPELDRFVYFMRDKLQWRSCTAAEKFAYVSALHLVSRNLTYNKPFPVLPNKLLKFVHILKERTKNRQPVYELEFEILNNDLKKLIEFDTLYVILEKEFVELVLRNAILEFENRTTKIRRKKKVFLPIYERYSKPKTPEPDPFKATYPPRKIKSKPGAGKKKPARPKTSRGRQRKTEKSPRGNDAESLASSLGTLSLISKTDGDSSDEEYVPLAERLAMRNGSETSTTRTATSTTSKLSTSSISSMSYNSSDGEEKREEVININITPSSSSETHNNADDINNEAIAQIQSEQVLSNGYGHELLSNKSGEEIVPNSPGTEFVLEQNYIDDEYSDHDSNIQLLPHSFIEEYLDKSRDDILGPVIPEEDEYEQNPSFTSDSGMQDTDNNDVSADPVANTQDVEDSLNNTVNSEADGTNASLVSVESRCKSSSFHQLAFVTPLRPGETALDNIEPPVKRELVSPENSALELLKKSSSEYTTDHAVEQQSKVLLDPNCESYTELKTNSVSDHGTNGIADVCEDNVSKLPHHGADEFVNTSAKIPDVITAASGTELRHTIDLSINKTSPVDDRNITDPFNELSFDRNESLDLSLFSSNDEVFSPKITDAKTELDGSVNVAKSHDSRNNVAKDLLETEFKNTENHKDLVHSGSDTLYEQSNNDSILDDSLTNTQILSIPTVNESFPAYDNQSLGTLKLSPIPSPSTLIPIPSPEFSQNYGIFDPQLPMPDLDSSEALSPLIDDRQPPPSPIMLSNEHSGPFSPIAPFAKPAAETPDTSFLKPDMEDVSTPAWKRKPLSDIQNQVSTPKSAKDDSSDVKIVTRQPLPDIANANDDVENFNLNLTELLDTTSPSS